MPTPKPRPPRDILLRPNKRLKDLAAEYNVAPPTLWRWRKKAGAVCKTRGEHHWNARLTAEDVRLIRELYASGIQQKALAWKFEVGEPTISHIVNYDRWTE